MGRLGNSSHNGSICDHIMRFIGVREGARTIMAIVLLAAMVIDFGAAEEISGEITGDLGTFPTPPSFTHEPNPHIMYFVIDSGAGKSPQSDSGPRDSLKERRLLCEANGYPEPKCHWLKDGQPLDTENDDRIVQQEGFGTIAIRRFQKSDEGEYQCYCDNDNGTAYDRPIQLKQTYIEYFPPSKWETVSVEMGAPFSRNCTPPDSVPPARVFWIYMGAGGKGSGTLTAFNSVNSSNIAMNDKGAIFLQHVREDEGQGQADLFFTCTVQNMELKDFKFGDQFKIQVIKRPGQSFPRYIRPQAQHVSPPDVHALRGESFELYCIFSGFPVQTPIWRKIQGGSIDWTRLTWGTNFNKSLKVENVAFEDEGIYECSFPNDPANKLARQFRVKVDAAPYWVATPPLSANSSEGETVQFDCDAAGRPRPQFTFYKNGRELYPDNYHIFIDGPKLKIVNLQKGVNGSGDNAVYQCKAENQYGFVWANFYLNLLSSKPVLQGQPGHIVGIIGQDPTLSCKFFGSPRPTVTWRTPPILGSKSQHSDALGVYNFRLYDIGKEHEGRYECYAENKHGNATGAGYLTVRRPTRIVTYPTDTTIVAGKTLRLPCKAEPDSHLPLTVSWLKYGLPVNTTNSRYVVENDALRIDNVVAVDSGEYTCVAHTDYDRVERTARIIVRDVPRPPQSVSVQCDSKSAAVDFHYVEFSDHSAAREFWAQYNIDPENEPQNWETHPTPVSQLNEHGYGSVRVSLHPYGNFAFRVFARNDVGDSAPTAASQTCVTPAAKPERNPAQVLVKGNTPEDVTVYWEPMPRRDWNGPKFHYVVDYNRAGEEPESITVDDPYRSSLVIPVREPYQQYEVTVRAKNAEGESTSTPQKVYGYSGEELPKTAPTGFEGKPLSSGTPTVAKFTWNKYEATDFKGELQGFKIEHWVESRKRSAPTRTVALFDPAATQGTVYDLKPHARNRARIMAYSGGGDGPASEVIDLDMPEGVPSAVQNLEAFPVSNNEVGAIWQQPSEINGLFRGYNVTWCRIGTTPEGSKVEFSSCKFADGFVTANYYRITGLESAVEYQVEVTGQTRAGPGAPNSALVRTLPNEAMNSGSKSPEVPSIRVDGVSEDHINVTWFPGKYNHSDGKPLGSDHYAEYKLIGDDKWTPVPHQGKNFTIQISGLQPGSTYEVRTVSVVTTEAGKLETRSNSTVVTTGGEATSSSTAGWLIAIIVAILLLIIILILVCLVVRNRGAKYPVSEKEKEQGREPMLKEEKGFGEYAKPGVDEEKRSLTAESKPESETDSMAEYGDGETGRFTEDGSFIGQYSAPNKVIVAPPASGTPATSNGATERGGKAFTTFI